MEENEQKQSTNELKKETVEAVNQVKETIKNVDIKNDAKEATGFVTSMFKDPFSTIKSIAEDKSNKNLKFAIIFVIIWVLAEFINAMLNVVLSRYWTGRLVASRLLSIVKITIAPIITILVLSCIIYLMNKENRKSILTTITSVVIAKIPVVFASIINLLTLISSNATPLTSRIGSFCSVVSIVLTYFSTKALFGTEQNSKFIKKFILIYAIYYLISLVIYYLGIYI